MKSRYLIVFFLFALMAELASSAPCVKIRKGESFTCMKFTPSERREAARYGLKLGAPFEVNKKILIEQGWVLDRQWFMEASLQPLDGEEMICGSGWDAACSTAFKKDDMVLELMLSRANDGLPLVGWAAIK